MPSCAVESGSFAGGRGRPDWSERDCCEGGHRGARMYESAAESVELGSRSESEGKG